MSDAASLDAPNSLKSDDSAEMKGDFTAADEPLRLFAAWFAEALKAEPNDPNAMALATVDADGLPNVRMVLLKGFDDRGFVFYTNEESRKGRELAHTSKAALVFHWKSLRRQVRLRGAVVPVSAAEADAYFASRARSSQVGAWASKQSRPLESRLAFEKAIALQAARFGSRHGAAPAVLERLPGDPHRDGVLGRPALPAARPDRVPPPWRRGGLEQDPALSVRRGTPSSACGGKSRRRPLQPAPTEPALPRRGRCEQEL